MGGVMMLSPGDSVRVIDDHGGEWSGRVILAYPDAVEVEYAGWSEIFRLPDGRRGSRYLRADQEAGT